MGLARVEEAILGAAVGVAVSMLVAPPLYLQPAGAAIGELAERMARFARAFGEGVEGPWSRHAADHWMGEARAVGDEVRAPTDRRPCRGGRPAQPARTSGSRRAPALPRDAHGPGALPPALRTLARAVLDRTYFVPSPEQASAYTRAQRQALGDAARLRRPGPSRPSHRSRAAASPRPPRACASRSTSRPSTSGAPASPACSPWTRRSTRPPGPSTARCWPPSTGCGWRSPPQRGRSTSPSVPSRRGAADAPAGGLGGGRHRPPGGLTPRLSQVRQGSGGGEGQAPNWDVTFSSIRRWMSSAVLLPAEHAHGGDAVEAHIAQGAEELVPVDLAVADLVVLVDPRVDPRRVDDVAVADVGPVVEAVRDVQVLQLRARVLHHPPHVARRRRRGGTRAGRRTRSSPTAC